MFSCAAHPHRKENLVRRNFKDYLVVEKNKWFETKFKSVLEWSSRSQYFHILKVKHIQLHTTTTRF
jgi:hypothetical protein